MTRALSLLLLVIALATACGGEESTAATDPAPVADPTPTPAPEPEPAPPPSRWPNEACARVIVVAYDGAVAAPDGVTRSMDEARSRAAELRRRVADAHEDIADVARAESDAASSGPRGGLLGTYARDNFPAAHEPIRDAIFALDVGAVSDVLEAPYGFVVAQRCEVEKIHTRHILVRYAGARNAPDDVTRTQAEARARAEELRTQVTAEGADFAAIARENSEDASAEDGGDLGMVGRGLLAPAYEAAAWQLGENAVAPVVETEFGYHVIQRLPDIEE
ncbi:MAG: peptidylprolyl isomerase [Sandaracinaceae bacterium]